MTPSRASQLRLAEAAARRAGAYLRGLADRGRVDREPGRDVKLAADRESEAILLAALKGSPLPALSEERGWTGPGAPGGLFWAVDPLDGSFNYLRGIAGCCVSVGLWEARGPRGPSPGRPLLGAVFDFDRGEMFTGLPGRGAWLNGRPIRVSRVDRESRAVLCTGLPASGDYSREGLRRFCVLARRYKKVRCLGAAALMAAYVGAGRADAYEETGIRLWDVAGALAVVQGAGGRVEVRKLEKLHCLHARATNGLL